MSKDELSLKIKEKLCHQISDKQAKQILKLLEKYMDYKEGVLDD